MFYPLDNVIEFFRVIYSFDVDCSNVPSVSIYNCIVVGDVSEIWSMSFCSRSVTFCMLFLRVDILVSVAMVVELSLMGA